VRKGSPAPFPPRLLVAANAAAARGGLQLRVLGQLLVIWKRSPKRHKVLVFSHYLRVLDVLEAFMQRRGYVLARFDGQKSEVDRARAIEDFSTREECFVMLVSTKAGGVGINLTAADIVVLFDNSWNPVHESQAQDRAFRLGQVRCLRPPAHGASSRSAATWTCTGSWRRARWRR
jgi:SNF2 family DNA or RNA helicase